MHLREIELINYKRLALSRIKRILITPKAKFQLILGTNSSGKSSLLKELTPNPADSKDYSKNGLKRIVIEHNNSIYELTSKLNPNKHHFIKDGEELNNGHTASIQKELIINHFGLTNSLHELFTHVLLFTDMSSSLRREWFTKLSNVNYNYVTNIYNNIKVKHRDIIGGIKTFTENLNNELQYVTSEDELNQIKSDLNTLQEHKNFLDGLCVSISKKFDLEHSSKIIPNVEKIDEYDNEMINLIKNKIAPIAISHNGLQYVPSLDLISNKITILETNINLLKKSISSLLKQKEEHSIELSKIEISNTQETIDRMNILEKELDKLYKENDLSEIEEHDIEWLKTDSKRLCDALVNIFTNLHPDEVNYISKDSLDKLENDIIKLNDEIKTLVDNQKRDKELMSVYVNMDKLKIHCPKCHTALDLSLMNKHNEEHDFNDHITDLQKKVNQLKTNKLDLIEQIGLLDKLESIQFKSKRYKLFWDKINNSNIKHHPINGINDLQLIYQQVDAYKLYLDYQDEYKKLQRLLKLSEDSSNEYKVKNIKLKIEAIETDLDALYKNLDLINKKLLLSNNSYGKYKDFWNNVKLFENTVKKTIDVSFDIIMDALDTHIKGLINKLNIDIGEKSKLINKANHFQTLKNSYESELEKLKVKQTIYSDLVDSLSPNTGLISKSLIPFLNNFIENMNLIISKIWTYPLEIMLNEDDNLDYNFTLNVGDENRLQDVKRGSRSVKEVINLAFVLVAMKYLNMTQYPIYLDEFGSSFDDKHRDNSINLVKQIMTSQNFSQLFMVSHYSSIYGSISNADIICLDDNNLIDKSKDFNKNVIIERY